jgi:hypothetical protein|mmetsp:Transcript_74480/g.125460  ORF Transcript_74480/g.125460 Transcript_74480/m.125460 type:complete len:112 (+) Transcript_74480:2879-3214(+)
MHVQAVFTKYDRDMLLGFVLQHYCTMRVACCLPRLFFGLQTQLEYRRAPQDLLDQNPIWDGVPGRARRQTLFIPQHLKSQCVLHMYVCLLHATSYPDLWEDGGLMYMDGQI